MAGFPTTDRGRAVLVSRRQDQMVGRKRGVQQPATAMSTNRKGSIAFAMSEVTLCPALEGAKRSSFRAIRVESLVIMRISWEALELRCLSRRRVRLPSFPPREARPRPPAYARAGRNPSWEEWENATRALRDGPWMLIPEGSPGSAYRRSGFGRNGIPSAPRVEQSAWPSYPNNTAISVTSSGNVGVGTRAPRTSLDVAGPVAVTNSDNLGATDFTSSSWAPGAVA